METRPIGSRVRFAVRTEQGVETVVTTEFFVLEFVVEVEGWPKAYEMYVNCQPSNAQVEHWVGEVAAIDGVGFPYSAILELVRRGIPTLGPDEDEKTVGDEFGNNVTITRRTMVRV